MGTARKIKNLRDKLLKAKYTKRQYPNLTETERKNIAKSHAMQVLRGERTLKL